VTALSSAPDAAHVPVAGARRPPPRARRWQPHLVIGLLLAASACALCLGTPYVPPHRLLGAVLDGDTTLAGIVVTELRLPRLVLALIAGACLGAAGLVLQEALRNPLAVPEMLGVSSGAALGVAAPLVLALSLPAAVQPVLALGGAALGGGLTLLAAGLGRSPSAVLLTGAAVAAALQAALLVLMVMADQLDLQLIYRYLLGSLSARTWDDVAGLWPWLLVAVPALVLCAPVLSVMRLGDEDAEALGVRAQRARLLALAIAVVLIAPVTAVCGPVAWVGFLAPHLARWFDPSSGAVRWLPWSAAWGAVVVTVADVPARLALAPVETPAGAWSALLGVPAGVALMRSGRPGRAGGRGAAGSARGRAPYGVPGAPPSSRGPDGEPGTGGSSPGPDGAPEASPVPSGVPGTRGTRPASDGAPGAPGPSRGADGVSGVRGHGVPESRRAFPPPVEKTGTEDAW
jgi:iron complex transport system permease protein